MKILFVVSSVLCVAATWFGLAAMVYYLDREEAVREWLLAHLLYIAALVLLPFALFVVAVVVVGMCGVYIRREYIKAVRLAEPMMRLHVLMRLTQSLSFLFSRRFVSLGPSLSPGLSLL